MEGVHGCFLRRRTMLRRRSLASGWGGDPHSKVARCACALCAQRKDADLAAVRVPARVTEHLSSGDGVRICRGFVVLVCLQLAADS